MPLTDNSLRFHKWRVDLTHGGEAIDQPTSHGRLQLQADTCMLQHFVKNLKLSQAYIV